MKVKELYEKLESFMKNNPNTVDDELYFVGDGLEVFTIDDISIEWDLDWEGRYIVLK